MSAAVTFHVTLWRAPARQNTRPRVTGFRRRSAAAFGPLVRMLARAAATTLDRAEIRLEGTPNRLVLRVVTHDGDQDPIGRHYRPMDGLQPARYHEAYERARRRTTRFAAVTVAAVSPETGRRLMARCYPSSRRGTLPSTLETRWQYLEDLAEVPLRKAV